MPPTVSGSNPVEKRPVVRPDAAERRAELVCRVKYSNTLPDIPFDPKFITYPFQSSRFIQYKPTSLERNYKYEVLTEHDLGVTIDLINRDTYACEPGATLDPADEKLLEDDVHTPQDSKRSRHHAKAVSWLRRTEYISTEQTRFQPQSMDKVEAKVGFSIKKELKEETLAMDREAQIKAIDKTFEDAKKPIEKHYSKPNVTPVEILPVFPDFKVWKYPCAQVIFDSDPAPPGLSVANQMEVMSQAMIRGVRDETGEQFVAYFLPTEETLEKRKADFVAGREYEDDEEYEYKMARQYNWNVKSKTSKGYEENYFLVLRKDGIYYNELETRVRLSKRRHKTGQAPNNTRLVVRHCPLSAQEFKMQRYRERQLEPPNEDDEDEDEEDEAGSDAEGAENKATEEATNEEKAGSESEGEHSKAESAGSESGRKSRSRSRSKSRSKSKSKSRSRSRSHSGSRSGSRSGSGSPARSGSGSPARSGSGSPARSGSGSPAKSGSGSPAKSGSGSPAKSGSGSPAKSGSGSPAGSARSGSASPARSAHSRSRSGSRSGSASPARSARSGSGSPARSGSGSPARSGSGSPARSGSGSPAGSNRSEESGSGSESN